MLSLGLPFFILHLGSLLEENNTVVPKYHLHSTMVSVRAINISRERL